MNKSFTQSELATVEKEHSLQIQLLNLLSVAVNKGQDNSEIISIIDQLLSFSQVHFMSEELIMRQHSYEGYDSHSDGHSKLIDEFHRLKQDLNTDLSTLDLSRIDDLKESLMNHIASQDQSLSIFLDQVDS